jgi:nucleotidyltransferase/DNA polymerase involved in DNA repair
LHPELKGKCVAVCGSEENRHGIVLAKNEMAKKYGVKTAETIWQAKKKCPALITIPPHFEEYRKYSNVDMAFGMYYQAGLMKLLSSDGHKVLREKFL